MSTLANYLDAHAKDPALSDVITTVTEVGKTISGLLKKGALADILGEAGNQNVQGEEQKPLAGLANDVLLAPFFLSYRMSVKGRTAKTVTFCKRAISSWQPVTCYMAPLRCWH